MVKPSEIESLTLGLSIYFLTILFIFIEETKLTENDSNTLLGKMQSLPNV